MLRLANRLSLVLLVIMSGIGLLVSHSWGWSEYASPELYLLYAQLTDGAPSHFFLINTDGSNARWQLTPDEGALRTVSCSPDGRTLALLADNGHLSVINQSGSLYERKLGLGYDTLAAANNGDVAVSKESYGIVLVVTPHDSYPPVPPDHIAYDPIKLSSSGNTLWSHTAQGGIKLLAPSGEMLLALAPDAASPTWLASEQMFTFTHYDQAALSVGGMVDTSRPLVAQVRHSMIPLGLLSPDARLLAVRYVDATRRHEQLYLVDPLTNQPKQQLTSDEDYFHLPMCFLTFRPEMLIS
jgi:hypothetical protein